MSFSLRDYQRDIVRFIHEHNRCAIWASMGAGKSLATLTALEELGYKVHTAATHGDFLVRFTQARYQVVVIEERFAANDITENLTLQAVQKMPMNERRHCTFVLFGESFQTFTPMQAFQQSVHAVINSSEMFMLNQLVEKAIAENNLFLRSYREVQNRVARL